MVQDNADQIWKFQRYRLVFEYFKAPILPPPLNLFAYVFTFFEDRCCKKINLNHSPSFDSVFSLDSKFNF